MSNPVSQWYSQSRAWLFQERHKQWFTRQLIFAERAFTEHPHETGESYLQHLWFTVRMAVRFIYVTFVLLLHGIFPFLFMRAASSQIEIVYRIMKTRIPKARRAEIDHDDDPSDYCV